MNSKHVILDRDYFRHADWLQVVKMTEEEYQAYLDERCYRERPVEITPLGPMAIFLTNFPKDAPTYGSLGVPLAAVPRPISTRSATLLTLYEQN